MGIEVEVVNKPEFEGYKKMTDEHYESNKERIIQIEKIQTDMVKLNTQFAEIINIERTKVNKLDNDVSDMKEVIIRMDEMLKNLDSKDKNKEQRISKFENEPREKYGRFIGWISAAAIGSIITYIMNIILT